MVSDPDVPVVTLSAGISAIVYPSGSVSFQSYLIGSAALSPTEKSALPLGEVVSISTSPLSRTQEARRGPNPVFSQVPLYTRFTAEINLSLASSNILGSGTSMEPSRVNSLALYLP